MKVLILGANGMLGPHVIQALEPHHTLRLTDVRQRETDHEFIEVDIADVKQVTSVAEGMDAIVNLSVMRTDRVRAFDVSARGCYNMMTAAVEHQINRVINTGPFYAVAGPTYERFDHGISPDVPPQPGTWLYALTKSLGHEICSVFSQFHNIYVINLLFYMFIDPATHAGEVGDPIAAVGRDLVPYTVSWSDAAESFICALETPINSLPSRCEAFFMFPNLPHGKFSNEKAQRLLGWEPKDDLSKYWMKVTD